MVRYLNSGITFFTGENRDCLSALETISMVKLLSCPDLVWSIPRQQVPGQLRRGRKERVMS